MPDNLPDETRAMLETRGDVVGSVWWIDATCRYLQEGRCSIYETRPEGCKAYAVDGEECRMTRERG